MSDILDMLMIIILGAGNTLRTDDGVGVLVVQTLKHDARFNGRRIVFCDGGAIGLALLPQIEDASAAIVVDAAEIGEQPGAVRVFEGGDMDARLRSASRTVHEVAVADLFAVAGFSGCLPQKRALVAIQSSVTGWGLTPTAATLNAVPRACDAVRALIERWSNDA